MRVGVISDIHGNLVALDAVLRALDREQISEIVCLGDVAASGPQPREVIERLQARRIPIISGNADAWLVKPKPEPEVDENAQRIVELDLWCRNQLTPGDLEYLTSFPATKEIFLENLKMFCCHGSPRSNIERILATTEISSLQSMLSGVTADIVACGHTHIQMVRRYMNQVIINPGSVGLPYDVIANVNGEKLEGARMRNPPWAEFATIGASNGELEVSLRRTPINREAVIHAAFNSTMPDPEWWTRDWRLDH